MMCCRRRGAHADRNDQAQMLKTGAPGGPVRRRDRSGNVWLPAQRLTNLPGCHQHERTFRGGEFAMDAKKVALLVGALVIAVINTVMAKNMFQGLEPKGQRCARGARRPESPSPARPAGGHHHRRRKPGLLDVAEGTGPERLLHRRFARGRRQKLIGTVVRNLITAGQPMTRGSLVGSNDRGFLAAALGPEMRAVTVPVSNTTGVAGFSLPGRPGRHGADPGRRRRRRRPDRSRFRKRSSATCACSSATDQRIDSKNAEARPRSRPSTPSRWKLRRASARRSPLPSRWAG